MASQAIDASAPRDLGASVFRTATGLSYRPEIDGLRSIAIVPVVLYHAGIQVFSGGYIGVDVFFVISGYLITGILLNDIAADRFSMWRFYERRARRILPALFAILACCLPLAWYALLPDEFSRFCKSILSVLGFSSNISFWREEGYFTDASELKPLLHTWSLAVEEQFYLAFPWVLFLLRRFSRPAAFWIIAAMALASFVLCEFATTRFQTANFYLAPTRAWELLGGSLCAYLGRQTDMKGADWLGWTGLALIVSSIFLLDGTVPFPSHYAIPCIAGTMLLILFADGKRGAGRVLALPPLVGIGLISYSLYLWHQPIFAFARLIVPGELTRGLMLGLSLLSVILAVLSWKFVEEPFRKRRGPEEARRSLLLAIGGALVLAAFAVWGLVTHGAPQRFARSSDPAVLAYAADLAVPRPAGDCKSDADGFVKPCADIPAPGAKRIALFGDSHALAILPAFEQFAREQKLELHFAALGGCPPLLGGYVINGNTMPEACARLAREELDHARAAGIGTVFLVGRWNLYVAPDALTQPGRYILSDRARPFFPTHADAMRILPGLMRRTVDAYRGAGIRVVLMEQVPQQTFRLDRYRRLLAYRPQEGGVMLAVRATSVPVTDWRERRSGVSQVLAVEEARGVPVLRMDDYFRQADRFVWGSPDESWYRDVNHLSRAGALRLVPAIAGSYQHAAR